jgi:uncharacterized membrane protein
MPVSNQWWDTSWKVRLARVFAGPVMTVAGINHFVVPETYASIIPDALPGPLALVYISGLAEIAGGLGTMHPRTRRAAGWFLIATLVAVYPGNLEMAVNADDYPGVPGGRATLLARLPLQILFIYWVWLATLSDEAEASREAGRARSRT